MHTRLPNRPSGAALVLAFGLPVLTAASPAAAEAVIARYDVHAAGLTVMKVEALFDLDSPGGGYALRTRIRLTGMLGLFSSGDQVTRVEGRWQGLDPQPQRYRVEGTWRGGRREVAMDYGPGGMPVLLALVPPNDPDREVVPPEMQRGTMDSLSALAKLTRVVARTGRCDAGAETYDGRRRASYTVRTEGLDMLPPHDGFGGGQAVRCAFESRLVAGRRADEDPEHARRPQPATAWLAPVPGADIPLPVRIEMPSRWFGTIRVMLTGLEPAPAQPVPPGTVAAASGRQQRLQQTR